MTKVAYEENEKVWKASRLAFTKAWSWMLVVHVWNPSTHVVEPGLLVIPSLKEPK